MRKLKSLPEMKRLNFKALTIFLLFFTTFASVSYAQEHTGKVIAIADGDTFTLMADDYEKKKIRLAEIDTPEKGQPYGDKAKKILSELIFGKQVMVKQTDIDRYGRIVGTVYVAGSDNQYLNVNKTMISNGAAWVYRQYSKDAELLEIEARAKAEEKGLWALPAAHRIAPWEWRHKSQEEIDRPAAASKNIIPSVSDFFSSSGNAKPAASGFKCAGKRYCGDMSSCSEARFYLTQCGLNRLDGDNDGVPCEKLCH